MAIALSAAFFLLWFTVINPQKKVETANSNLPEVSAPVKEKIIEDSNVTASSKTSQTPSPIPNQVDPYAAIPIKTWTIKSNMAEVELTSDGGVPTSWKILGYRQSADAGSPIIDLVALEKGLTSPLSLSFAGANFNFPQKPRFELTAADDSHVVFKWRSSEAEITKTITFKPGSYLADISIDIKNLTSHALEGRPMLTWSGVTPPVKKEGFFSFLKQPSPDNKVPVSYVNGKVHRQENIAKIAKPSEQQGQVLWSGLESRYFLGAVIPRVQGQGLSSEYGLTELPDAPAGSRGMWAAVALPSIALPAGASASALFSAYAGPKEIGMLKDAGVRLEEAIDYGWFTVVAVPILYLLRFFHGAIGNWGVAIILLTIFVKLLLHPINVKSLKSMKAMQALQPKLKELQQKFKDDKQRLNQETMLLFRSHKVNPMGGCLPMLLQFPIYIALYKVLWNSIELYHAPFVWFYKDLSAPDPYLITPILLGIFMVAQQKLMPSTSADPAQQKMMMLMPVMFSVFMLFLPVGLVVYILINTAMSVSQQYMYNKGIRYRDLLRGKWLPAKV